jgi:hypothetical protein
MRRARLTTLAWSLALLVVATLPAVAAPADATHEITHRYIVYGTVTNTSGVPLPQVTVTVEVPDATTHSSDPVWTGVTDINGNYRIQLHLHHLGGAEEDQGKEMIIRVPAEGVERRATATPSAAPPGEDPEHSGWGYTRMDFQFDKVAPTPPPPPPPVDVLAGLAASAAAIGVIAVAALLLAVLYFGMQRSSAKARIYQQELSVTKLPGVGRATAEKLRAGGFATIPQLARAEVEALAGHMKISETEARRLINKAASHQNRDA